MCSVILYIEKQESDKKYNIIINVTENSISITKVFERHHKFNYLLIIKFIDKL